MSTDNIDYKKAQIEWDTLIVVGWRKFWNWNQVFAAYHSLGYRYESARQLQRAPDYPKYLKKIKPVRAVISESSKEMFRLLDSCKTTDDYLRARNKINASSMSLKYKLESSFNDAEETEAAKSFKKDALQNSAALIQIHAVRNSYEKSKSTRRKTGRPS